MTRSEKANHVSFRVLGARVDAVQIPSVIAQMERWIEDRTAGRFITVANTHVVMQAQQDTSFKEVINSADLCVPDGMPLVWCGRLRGHSLGRRVYGPELMLTFCRETTAKGYRHFFYGGDSGVPERLAASLRQACPGICVAGTFSPPFRRLSPKEDAYIVQMIHRAAPDVLWVGLGAPKQEKWMREHRDRLNVPVLVGVGAAFDFHAGTKRQAPPWMREHGLEWFFRLFQEPQRLWRRYLVNGPQFVFYVLLEFLGVKKFD